MLLRQTKVAKMPPQVAFILLRWCHSAITPPTTSCRWRLRATVLTFCSTDSASLVAHFKMMAIETDLDGDGADRCWMAVSFPTQKRKKTPEGAVFTTAAEREMLEMRC